MGGGGGVVHGAVSVSGRHEHVAALAVHRRGQRNPVRLALAAFVEELQVEVDARAHGNCHDRGERDRGRLDHVVRGTEGLDTENDDVGDSREEEVHHVVPVDLPTEV